MNQSPLIDLVELPGSGESSSLMEAGPGRAAPAGPRGPARPRPGPGRALGRPRREAGTNATFWRLAENVIERLPVEVLMKILSYLDAAALVCISSVSKRFHQLANENSIWQKIYTLQFGSQVWKADEAEPEVVERGLWKKQYMWMMAGQEIHRWRRELRDVSTDTGLPRQTERVLRRLNVSWELTVGDCFGRQRTFQQSRASFLDASVIVCWSGGGFPSYRHFNSIQLHGVWEVPRSAGVRSSCWRSLISELQVKPHPDHFIGKDQLISLVHVPPSFLVGIWRSWSGVAFIMTSLHFHRLVEKSLLGMPFCPYAEPVDRPPGGGSHPEFGLHGYTLHFALHHIDAKIMSGHFHQLSRQTVQVHDGLMELRVIDRSDLQQHRPLSGSVRLPWRAGPLEGSIQDCCFVTLTLLEDFHRPFCCISAPICLRAGPRSPSCDYSGEHFLMERRDAEGAVALRLVWLREQQQFFLISLIVWVPVPRTAS